MLVSAHPAVRLPPLASGQERSRNTERPVGTIASRQPWKSRTAQPSAVRINHRVGGLRREQEGSPERSASALGFGGGQGLGRLGKEHEAMQVGFAAQGRDQHGEQPHRAGSRVGEVDDLVAGGFESCGGGPGCHRLAGTNLREPARAAARRDAVGGVWGKPLRVSSIGRLRSGPGVNLGTGPVGR
jgi:hypothetical protein